jgi:putative hydrolase of the HAD superfamily
MTKKIYKHIFFDLDDTLWDFRTNSGQSLRAMYHKYALDKTAGISSVDEFILKYQERNIMMWEQYRLGAIDKTELRSRRFELTFWDMGIDTSLVPQGISEDYLADMATRDGLFPHTIEILEYLSGKYSLSIITNGFPDIQYNKLNSSGIGHFFSGVYTSEHVGHRKPDVNIFLHALRASGANAEESLMIGDGLDVDIAGARNAGIDQVYFNPHKNPHMQNVTHEIESLLELKNFL